MEEYDLPTEEKEYSEKQLTRIDNMVKRGETTKEQAEFFKKNQRVELNALSPTEFVDFVERRLEEEGVEKVKPEEEDINEPDIPDPEQVKRDALNKAIRGCYEASRRRRRRRMPLISNDSKSKMGLPCMKSWMNGEYPTRSSLQWSSLE